MRPDAALCATRWTGTLLLIVYGVVIIYKIDAKCPDMRAQVDMVQIREVLNDSPGFNQVQFDLGEQSLVIYTANQDGGRDVLHKLSHAGFPAEDYTIDALPDRAERTVPNQ